MCKFIELDLIREVRSCFALAPLEWSICLTIALLWPMPIMIRPLNFENNSNFRYVEGETGTKSRNRCHNYSLNNSRSYCSNCNCGMNFTLEPLANEKVYDVTNALVVPYFLGNKSLRLML